MSSAIGVSEATLRRKLATAGTSLTDIIADVRMTRAASLLQATELPINRVALEVGYESASKFAARFRERFGLARATSACRRRRLRDMEPKMIGSGPQPNSRTSRMGFQHRRSPS